MGGLFNPEDEHGWSAWDYARAILGKLDDLVDVARDRDKGTGQPIRRRHPFVIQTDGAGFGQVNVFLPAGVRWTLLSYAFQGAAAGGTVAFYQDVEEGTGLLISAAIGAAPTTAGFSAEGDVIPEQSSMLVVVRGAQANSVVSGNVKCKGETNVESRPTVAAGEF